MDLTPFIVLGGGVFGLGIISFLAYRLGRISIIKEQATSSLKVKDEQIKIVVNRPSKSDVVAGLRIGDF